MSLELFLHNHPQLQTSFYGHHLAAIRVYWYFMWHLSFFQTSKIWATHQIWGIVHFHECMYEWWLSTSTFLKCVIVIFIIYTWSTPYRYSSHSVAKTITTTLVSRLDHYNSPFHNITLWGITKLQSVQNCLVRVLLSVFTLPLLHLVNWWMC